MHDFTLKTFQLLLQELKGNGYTFQTFRDFLKAPAPKAIVLRHDVDARKLNSLQTARLEAGLGIVGTYNFRIVPQSFDAEVIRQIAELGHEIGYHYEDLALVAKKGLVTSDKGQGRAGMGNGTWEERLYDAAIKSFKFNLEKLRQIVPIDTICMHGSPLSRYDNRKMWEHFNYRNYGITGEPYFDVDFSKVLYLTDTGRRWDGERVSVRDKVTRPVIMNRDDEMNDVPLRRACPDSSGGQGEELKKHSFHSTYDIINAVKARSLPPQLMITVHPQRWEDKLFYWIIELIMQNIKNFIKSFIARKKN